MGSVKKRKKKLFTLVRAGEMVGKNYNKCIKVFSDFNLVLQQVANLTHFIIHS